MPSYPIANTFPWVLKSISLDSNHFDLGIFDIFEACSGHLGKQGRRRTTVLVVGIQYILDAYMIPDTYIDLSLCQWRPDTKDCNQILFYLNKFDFSLMAFWKEPILSILRLNKNNNGWKGLHEYTAPFQNYETFK